MQISTLNMAFIYLSMVTMNIASTVSVDDFNCSLEILSNDHAVGEEGQYFNFDILTANCELGYRFASADTFNIFYSGDSSYRTVVLWSESQGGSIGDGHGRIDPKSESSAGDWETGQFIAFTADVPCDCTPAPTLSCSVEILSNEYKDAQVPDGRYFFFDIDAVSLLLGYELPDSSYWTVFYSGDNSLRDVVLWDDIAINGQSTNAYGTARGDGSGRRNPYEDAAEGDWEVGEFISFTDCPRNMEIIEVTGGQNAPATIAPTYYIRNSSTETKDNASKWEELSLYSSEDVNFPLLIVMIAFAGTGFVISMVFLSIYGRKYRTDQRGTWLETVKKMSLTQRLFCFVKIIDAVTDFMFAFDLLLAPYDNEIIQIFGWILFLSGIFSIILFGIKLLMMRKMVKAMTALNKDEHDGNDDQTNEMRRRNTLLLFVDLLAASLEDCPQIGISLFISLYTGFENEIALLTLGVSLLCIFWTPISIFLSCFGCFDEPIATVTQKEEGKVEQARCTRHNNDGQTETLKKSIAV